MSEVPGELKYVSTHEWVRIDDNVATIGITDHAQTLLGDLVFVELPEVGQQVVKGEECTVIESVKSASDIISPLTGKISEVNELLSEKPELINEDVYGDGWILRIKLSEKAEIEQLLSADQYAECVENEDH
ncbi:MAG: glycine cleavage system protein GcvH [Methylococcales bacterium]|jgi:glycine cleavage system H protein|nr:glycine cleavage system protein GcvH [Methylococcales bacterium]MBT7409120.1 glycine cleavage system protein GcvH [Methylococcales bacterium]